MILQSLYDYYNRRQADPDPTRRLPAFGLEEKEIPFVLEIDGRGALVAITDTRHGVEGKRPVGTKYRVPARVKRSSAIAANLFWDNAEYALGLPNPAKAGEQRAEYLARLERMRSEFVERIASQPPEALADAGVQALLVFLRRNPTEEAKAFPQYSLLVELSPDVSFRLASDSCLICERPAVAASYAASLHEIRAETDGEQEAIPPSRCLITGERASPQRLHAAIKGVWGAQTSGANIVSFNCDAFRSYGHVQGANAPVSPGAAFAYTTALNSLLASDSSQRVQVGDASTVFWAQRAEPYEGWLKEILGGGDDPDLHAQRVKELLRAVQSGTFNGTRGENAFFVLGLAPNAARLSVRFWYEAPLSAIAARIVQWFEDLRIARGPRDPEYPGLYRLLSSVAVLEKTENVPPRLGGDLMASVFAGTPLPRTWLNLAVQRCRTQHQVNHLRAAIIKAYLLRASSSRGEQGKRHLEIQPMLDPSNPSSAYRLGRLFAVLEKVQEEANPGLNTTIRERYYGAASTAPVAVFPTLLRLKNHHLAKLDNRGRVVKFERILGDIVAGLDGFPVHLDMVGQGLFAVGYYHQRQDFFTKPEATVSKQEAETTNVEGGN